MGESAAYALLSSSLATAAFLCNLFALNIVSLVKLFDYFADTAASHARARMLSCGGPTANLRPL
jgi:hypothetical protein